MTGALSKKLFTVKNNENSTGVIVTKCKFPSYFSYLGIKEGDLLLKGDKTTINEENYSNVIKTAQKLTLIRNEKIYMVNTRYRFEIV